MPAGAGFAGALAGLLSSGAGALRGEQQDRVAGPLLGCPLHGVRAEKPDQDGFVVIHFVTGSIKWPLRPLYASRVSDRCEKLGEGCGSQRAPTLTSVDANAVSGDLSLRATCPVWRLFGSWQPDRKEPGRSARSIRRFRRQAIFVCAQGGETVPRGPVPLARRLSGCLVVIPYVPIAHVVTINAVSAPARRRRLRLRPTMTGFIQVSLNRS